MSVIIIQDAILQVRQLLLDLGISPEVLDNDDMSFLMSRLPIPQGRKIGNIDKGDCTKD
ncbi:MAG TPA: hypothetical protein V6D19_19030 [Stenomitos sp.]